MEVENKAGMEEWGYVEVRKDAHMFWWLYYTTKNVAHHTNAPLILWLAGGPGNSSCGKDNFEGVGPLTAKLTSRQWTWVKLANVVFVDSPVGSGFSYVKNGAKLCRTVLQITTDLFAWFKEFLKKCPELQEVPLYIVSESFGGHSNSELSLEIHRATKNGSLKANLQACVLSTPWVSPIDHTKEMANYLYALSILDSARRDKHNVAIRQCVQAIEDRQFEKSFVLWWKMFKTLQDDGLGADCMNNIHYNFSSSANSENADPAVPAKLDEEALEELLNGPIRKKLDIPDQVKWGSEFSKVYLEMSSYKMRSCTDTIQTLIANTPIKVIVIAGQLDSLCNVLSQTAWIERLKWNDIQQFKTKLRTAINLPEKGTVGYVKNLKDFTMYWVFRGGHMLPRDVPEEAYKIMDMILNTNHIP